MNTNETKGGSAESRCPGVRLEHTGEMKRLALNPWSQLLAEWSTRPHATGRDVASHPMHLLGLVERLDAAGQTEAADSIHSLVFELAVHRQRAIRDLVNDIEIGIMVRDGLIG